MRRSDQVDVRRLGKVSEDERSVLRIEWRAGLAGIDETRSVQEMLDKLRRLETTIGEVSRLIRDMPVQRPGIVTTTPVAAQAPEPDGYDFRLAVANMAALALVALWWFRRRKPEVRPETGPASSPKMVPPGATLPAAPPPIPAPLAKTPLSITPPKQTSPEVASAAMPESGAVTAAKSGADLPRSEPVALGDAPELAPDPSPATTAEPVATASSSPPEAKPAEPLPANEAPIIEFSPEGAAPEVVARENAEFQAPPPVSAPKPAQTSQETDVEPTLQLAEIMLSMGLEQGAAQALIEYIETHPRHAVYHWLKLLGIYRSRGLQKEFTETAEKLRTHFNIQAEEWGKPADEKVPMLESFSRVSEHVQKTWSQPEECITYLRNLLEDNREGARAGFPQSVAEEILFLVEILKEGPAA